MSPVPHIIVGLSGGVDSAVAALRLKQEGFQITGLFMKNWEEEDTTTYCSSEEDLNDIRAVCDKIKIELLTINFAYEYWQNVFREFLDEYAAGRTPNPDILCNQEIKFKCFLDYALKQGADYIATGHYAKTLPLQSRPFPNYPLLKAKDTEKDQTYFLYTLGQKQLSKTLFPLGDLTKTQVRYLAKEEGLINHSKKDSTGICFIGERKFKTFLEDFLPAKPGTIQTVEGETIGQHDGLMFYTLGQRQGLKIGGRKNAALSPWYVVGKNIPNNILIVTQGKDHPWHYSTQLFANRTHWVYDIGPDTQFNCTAKVRYRQQEVPCTVTVLSTDLLEVTFITPQWAVTPGQSIVFYDKISCLGGATITQTNSPGGLNVC